MKRDRPERRAGYATRKEAHRANKSGLTYQEISERLGIPRSTVQHTEIQAMAKLKRAFVGYEMPPARGHSPLFKYHAPDCD